MRLDAAPTRTVAPTRMEERRACTVKMDDLGSERGSQPSEPAGRVAERGAAPSDRRNAQGSRGPQAHRPVGPSRPTAASQSQPVLAQRRQQIHQMGGTATAGRRRHDVQNAHTLRDPRRRSKRLQARQGKRTGPASDARTWPTKTAERARCPAAAGAHLAPRRTAPGRSRRPSDRHRRGSTSSAAPPATSGMDEVFELMTGTPQAIASISGKPNPSYRGRKHEQRGTTVHGRAGRHRCR